MSIAKRQMWKLHYYLLQFMDHISVSDKIQFSVITNYIIIVDYINISVI
jgi:hypothetical protein